MKVAYKIFIFFFILLSSATILLSYVYYIDSKNIIIDRINDQLNSVITLKTNHLDRILLESKLHIQSISKNDVLIAYLKEYHGKNLTGENRILEKRYDEEQYEERAVDILREQLAFANFVELFVLTSDGEIELSTNVGSKGQYKKNDPYFVEGIKGLYVKNFYYSMTLNSPAMTISAPIMEDNVTYGVIVGRFNLDVINKLMTERSGMGETGETYLIDNTGLLLTESRSDQGIAFKKKIHTTGASDCLNKNSGYDIYPDYKDIEVVSHYVWLSEENICMIAEIDTSEAFMSINNLRNNLVIYVLILIVISSIIAYYLSLLITRPISELVKGAELIAQKNFDIQLDIKSSDEFKNLADSFNNTAQELKQSDELNKEFNKKLEEDINIKTHDLKQKIDEINKSRLAVLNMMDDINETNLHLKDLDEAKTNFLNVASHELKTPLTAMSAYLDVLDDSKGEFNEEQKIGLDAIKRNSNQLKLLINNILEISRIESGRFEVNISSVDVSAKILFAVENLKILAENKKITINTEIAENLPKIMADDMRFDEILNNLISNAIKFTDTGSITIKADVEKSGKFITMRIIDTGVGIPEDKINNLFQNFYQVDSSISRKYGGTGLGLALTKKIIEHQGGTITVESLSGKGTTFIVNLPISQEKQKMSE